ncbi:MAG: acyl-CoA dehydrogenase [Halieaceae bacterium]|jgi:acyl-CoA dehydrogenase|nr:acyl-CoA dehydrogenase [Halieaceae bacterium]
MSQYIHLPISGLEPPLNEIEAALQDSAHSFAKDVLRPIGAEVDTLSPETAIAPESPLWQAVEQAKTLGASVTLLAELEPLDRARFAAIISEEYAWGDAGVGGLILISQMPALFSVMVGNSAMVELCDGRPGCWAITESDHGTDMLDAEGSLAAVDGSYGPANCVARIEGDKIVINGQKSAWISGAITAEVCALCCHVEDGAGSRPGLAMIVPLDAKGVSRGKPLDKIGLRGMNQGELFFDNVEVPMANLLAGPDSYSEFVHNCWASVNAHVACMFVGVARAAYEHALAYAHERKQGGTPIIQHQNVRSRIFHMFRKVEAARALARRVVEYNETAPMPALQGSMAAKVTSTQTAFEVASEALQIFGGYGLTKDYPMEKLLRDARAGLILDGCNEILAIKAGSLLTNPELL